MSESLCKTCKHKDDCYTTVRLYGIPNMRVEECVGYEPKEGAEHDYEYAVDQLEHDIEWEPTFNAEDGSM